MRGRSCLGLQSFQPLLSSSSQGMLPPFRFLIFGVFSTKEALFLKLLLPILQFGHHSNWQAWNGESWLTIIFFGNLAFVQFALSHLLEMWSFGFWAMKMRGCCLLVQLSQTSRALYPPNICPAQKTKTCLSSPTQQLCVAPEMFV